MRWGLVAVLLAAQCDAAQSYAASGLAIAVDRSRQTVTISHDKIGGYMDAMMMPFHVRDPKLLNGIEPGARVDFVLRVDQSASWIERLQVKPFQSAAKDPDEARRLGLAERVLAGPAGVKQIAAGQQVPDFSLIDQNNRKVSLSQFAGKVVALNFAYTRCPLPDFCFRLSNNLSQVRKRFAERMGKDLVLITITFDPLHDTPEVMAKYAHIWNAEAGSWHFLTGPVGEVQRVCGEFGVEAWQNEGILSHSLHTAVIGRDGRLAANLEGNEFSARQLGDLVGRVIGERRER